MSDSKLIYKPLISVISVCCNVVEDLEKTINSVIQQTYGNIEYIIVDGGSVDGTIELIKRRGSDISKWISEPDRGIYDAMNKGIDMASGEWIIFMNAGDTFYYDDAIADLFSHEYGQDVKLIYGDVMLDFGKLGLLPKKFWKIAEDRIPFEICHQSVLTKADILKRLHYDLSFKICADCNSFAEIYRMGYKLEYVPIFISKFEVVEGISSQRVMLSYKEHCKVEGVNPYSVHRLPTTFKIYLKSVLIRFLPQEKYNSMRYKSVKSRSLYM